MPDQTPKTYERFEGDGADPARLYRTVEQIRASQADCGAQIAKLGVTVATVVNGQTEMMDFLRGDLKGQPGLKHRVDDHTGRLDDHGQRIRSLEDSRDQVLPLVAAHKSRKKDWGAFKGSLIGVAAGGLGGWLWNKLTGKAP